MTLLERFNQPGPKRILALDGGGIRGALTLGYLQKLEDILSAQSGKPDFTLSDYFDLIGGTSTGSIIASALAIGMKVHDIRDMYFNLGPKIFNRGYSRWNVAPGAAKKIFNLLLSKADYDARPLEAELENLFGDITLGSDKIKTGLCIVAKRADTNSVWPLINHPGGKYFNSKEGTNKNILLWKAIRASAAAPTYFIPQVIDVGGGTPSAAFVDGGVSMANNPALQLLMVSTLHGFPFKWKMGADNIFIVSMGTGVSKVQKMATDISAYQEYKWASSIPDMLMQDASWQNQLILQWLSKSPTACVIDGEIGTLDGDLLGQDTDGKGLISYVRYNTWLTKVHLDELMEQDYTEEKVADLIEMDHGANCQELYEIGKKAGEKEILPEHFPISFAPLYY